MPSTKDLLKLALEQKPNAFREVFDELMLAKIVDISDEMKNDIAQSMFGESSHMSKKKKEKKDEKRSYGEAVEAEEDEEFEDEDFEITDEDLEDLEIDLEDEDFEDEEISESNMKRLLGDKSYGSQTPEELARLKAKFESPPNPKRPANKAAEKEKTGK